MCGDDSSSSLRARAQGRSEKGPSVKSIKVRESNCAPLWTCEATPRQERESCVHAGGLAALGRRVLGPRFDPDVPSLTGFESHPRRAEKGTLGQKHQKSENRSKASSH